MDHKEEVKPSYEGKNIYQRMLLAQSKVSYVQKDKPQKLQYSVVTHDAVTAKCRPALMESGIYYFPHAMEFTQDGNRTQAHGFVRFVNVDLPDEFVDVPTLGYGIDNQDKGPGKAISYAVKYGLLKGLGLETGDDADLDNQEHQQNPVTAALTDAWLGGIYDALPPDPSPASVAGAMADTMVFEINEYKSLNALTAYYNKHKSNLFFIEQNAPEQAETVKSALGVKKAELETAKAKTQ